MKVTIARVAEIVYEGDAYSLTVPGAAGEMTILAHHMPLVSTLKKGTVTVRVTKDAEPQEFEIEAGVLEVSDNTATVLL